MATRLNGGAPRAIRRNGGRDTLIDPALRLAAMLKDGSDPLERGGRARTTIEAAPA